MLTLPGERIYGYTLLNFVNINKLNNILHYIIHILILANVDVSRHVFRKTNGILDNSYRINLCWFILNIIFIIIDVVYIYIKFIYSVKHCYYFFITIK